MFESPRAKYPVIVGLRLARAQNGRGLWAHFLPLRSHTRCLPWLLFPHCKATGAYSRGLLTSYNGLPMPGDGLGRGQAEAVESREGERCRTSAAQDRGAAVGLQWLGAVGLMSGTAALGC